MDDMDLSRVSRLLGEQFTERMKCIKVIVFGIGGVGSWCAETLVRSGVRHITLVDADTVAESNINRQVPALHSTIGESKVDVMAHRIKDICPSAYVECINSRYTAENSANFILENYDYVIDAIDSLSDKANLIIKTTSLKHPVLFSSMGAAQKLNPARVQVAEFWKVKGCPLAAALRRRFKKSGDFPHRKFKCVYSDELIRNQGEIPTEDSAMNFDKIAYNGALCHITGIFGMTLASLVIQREAERLPLK